MNKLLINAYMHGSESDRIEFINRINDLSLISIDQETYTEWENNLVSKEIIELYTNGSTRGVRHIYRFSPYSVIDDVETLQKGSSDKTIALNINTNAIGLNDNNYNFDPYQPSLITLFDHIRNNDKTILRARPNTWLYLSTNNEFIDNLTRYHDEIDSIVSTDWDLFIDRKKFPEQVHINDCMIDWQTGLNFNTCKNNNRHFLPMFGLHNHKPYNWLNLCNKTNYATLDDVVVKEGIIKCECGAMAQNLTITSRGKLTFIHDFDSLAVKLSGIYASIQFIRTNDVINVYYISIGEFVDRDLIIAEFIDYQINFIPDKFCITGIGKWPSFWDTAYGYVAVADWTGNI